MSQQTVRTEETSCSQSQLHRQTCTRSSRDGFEHASSNFFFMSGKVSNGVLNSEYSIATNHFLIPLLSTLCFKIDLVKSYFSMSQNNDTIISTSFRVMIT